MSTPQAAEHFGVNIKTIRRWISNGKLFAEMVDGRWHVHIEGHDVPHESQNGTDNGKHLQVQLKRADSENQLLRDQLNLKDQQIESLIQQLDHSQQITAFSQKNVTMLSEQLDDSRQLIEEMRNRKPFWKRFFKR